MSQTLSKPILLDETGQAIKQVLKNIDDTNAQDLQIGYEDVHSEMDDNVKAIADSLDGIVDAIINSGGEKDPVSINITTPPTKSVYKEGENLILNGIAVSATFTNKQLFDITSDCVFSPANGDVLDRSSNTLTASWVYPKTGYTFTATTNLSVIYPISISITTMPDKINYVIGESLDLTGIVVRVTFNDGSTEDITSECTFNPADGTVLPLGASDINISWEWGYTHTVFTTSFSVLVPTVKLVTWADGTDAEISDMLAAHYNDELDVTQFWSVGDERVIHLNAMTNTVVNESHVAQDVTFVLLNEGGKELVTPINEHTECAFVVGQKYALGADADTPYPASSEQGYMNHEITKTDNPTWYYNWKDCDRRTWCNGVYKNAFPSSIINIFKEHKNISANTSPLASIAEQSSITNDYFALPAYKEFLGDIGDTSDGPLIYSRDASHRTYSYPEESENIWFQYYKTSANRPYSFGRSLMNYWDLNGYAPNVYYNSGASKSSTRANNSFPLAPFGVI